MIRNLNVTPKTAERHLVVTASGCHGRLHW